MSTWRLVVEFDWPDTFPETIKRNGREDQPKHMQDIVFEVMEPFNRENIIMFGTRLELVVEPDGSY